MKSFKGCLIASDIDGTLIESGFIPEDNIKKASEFVSLGGVFSLATGRSAGAVGPVLKKLKGIVGPCVVANGCMIYDFSKEQIVSQKELPFSAKEAVFKVYKNFENIGLEIHSENRVFVFKDRENKELIDHRDYEEIEVIFTEFNDIINEKWNKVLFTCEDYSKLDDVNSFFESYETDASIVHTTAVIYEKLRHYRELLPKGVNKATALKELCEILKIKAGGFFAIGDYYNDMEMLKLADISACPKNSPDDIKEFCSYHTRNVTEGAVADFIDYLKGLEE